MPRPSNTGERRREIVEALIAVMARQGYEGASIAAVAAEAGLVPGLVHYHFDSKLAILIEVVGVLHDRLRERTARFLARAADDPRARLDAFLDAHVATGPDADPAAVACWVALAAEAIRVPEVRDVYQQVVRAELAELERLVAAVQGDATGARASAAALYAAIQGAYQLATAAPGSTPAGFAAPALRRMADALTSPTRVRRRA